MGIENILIRIVYPHNISIISLKMMEENLLLLEESLTNSSFFVYQFTNLQHNWKRRITFHFGFSVLLKSKSTTCLLEKKKIEIQTAFLFLLPLGIEGRQQSF